MKKITLFIIIALISLSVFGVFTSCEKEEVDDNLVFFDDFDTLDTSVWNVYTKKTDVDEGWGPADGIRRGGYWDKGQVFTQDGNLVIRTEKKADGKYYTGAIDTDNKFERHYGYYETRVYMPKGHGFWAAFWIFCNNMGAQSTDAKISGTEIDVFETPYYGLSQNGDTDCYQYAIHIGDYADNYYTRSFVTTLTNRNVDVQIYDDWHVFAVDWQEDYYRFYYDDILMKELTLQGNISNVDSFLFLSVEIGGNNAIPDETPFLLGRTPITKNEDNLLPQDFLVDYVKVYKTKPQK